jgi:hypothetical protein
MITALFSRMLPDFRKRTALIRVTHFPTGRSDKVIFENKEECSAEHWWNDTERENANYAETKICPIANLSKTKLTWISSKYKPWFPQLKPAID